MTARCVFKRGEWVYLTKDHSVSAQHESRRRMPRLRKADRARMASAPKSRHAMSAGVQYLAKNPNGYYGLKGTGVSCPIGGGVQVADHLARESGGCARVAPERQWESLEQGLWMGSEFAHHSWKLRCLNDIACPIPMLAVTLRGTLIRGNCLASLRALTRVIRFAVGAAQD
jgi:hypothetical protein